MNGCYSVWSKVISGIPQGSIIVGPLLFILYINDLVDSCDSNCDLYLYADDVKLFKHETIDEDIKVLQNNIENLQLDKSGF